MNPIGKEIWLLGMGKIKPRDRSEQHSFRCKSPVTRRERGDDFLEARIAAQRIPKRQQF